MQPGNITTFATAGANKVVSTGPAVLERIIIGRDVGSANIEVSDHPADGDGNVKIDIAGDTLMTSTSGIVEVHATFKKGICADLTAQTHVTFIWRPVTL